MEKTMTRNYSVIVPVFNSCGTLKELFIRISKNFEVLSIKNFEVIFIDDCSKDSSWNVLREIKAAHPDNVQLIRLSRNFGQHNAIMCGLNNASGETVITIDDDLQIPPEEISHLINKYEETRADVVYGIYGKKQHHILRNLGSHIVQKVFRWVFNSAGDITSFRLINNWTKNNIIQHKQNFVYVDGLIHWYTMNIQRAQVQHLPRKEGKSGYSLTKLIKLATNLVFNFTTLPLRMVVYLGCLISITSFFTGSVFILRKFMFNVPIGYTSIIVSLFFLSGLILFALGIIGEYLNRLYSLQNNRPQYSITEMY